METIGKKIRRLREEQKLTQGQLGARCSPPLPREHISHYETDTQAPGSSMQERIARGLGITLVQLLEGVTFRRRSPRTEA